MPNGKLLDERKGPALLNKEPRVLPEERKMAAFRLKNALGME